MRKFFIGLMVICLFVSTAATLAPPTNVTADDVPDDNGKNISITWTESIDTVTEYEIFRATSESGDYDPIDTSATNSYFDNPPLDYTDYWYEVSATNGTNSSSSKPFGPVQSKDNLEPIITDVTNGTVTDSTAVITWTTNENSSSLVKYGTESLNYDKSLEDLVKSHSINLDDLNANTKYYYVVNSTDEGDNSDQSDEYNFSTTEDITEPEVDVISPERNEEDVAITSDVKVIFSESMDQETINTNSFYIDGPDRKIIGEIDIITDNGLTTATFNPEKSFEFDEEYMVTVTTKVTDLVGINMTSDYNWNFTTSVNQGPSLENFTVTPKDGTSPVTFYFYVTYKDIDNEPADYVKVFVDGELRTMHQVDKSDQTTSDGKKYEYNITLTNEGSYDCYFEASDGTTTPIKEDSIPKTIKVNSKTYESGNRIWDEDEDMSDTYTWTPQSFSGFYYNLDTDEGKENLTITNIGERSIENGDIEYVTKPIVKEFECDDFGNYSVIGFMAERYFAGYEEDSIMNDGFSLLDEEILSRVLIDDDESQMIKSGIPLVLEEGYEFRVTEYAASGDDVMVALFKDGESIYETILSEGSTFTYEKDMGSADDIPIIALHVDTVFRGMETSTISIDGIFQISDDYINVEDGDEFGLMEIYRVGSDEIIMVNSNDVSLKKGKTFNLMGKINIEVGNCDEIRFALAVDTSEPGTYELRGTVTDDLNYLWTPLNFEGLLYDMDSGESTETLKLDNREGRTIKSGNLDYITSTINMSFEYSGWDDYESIGFMGEKYFAGYKAKSIVTNRISLMNKGYLGEILIDEGEKHTLYVGNSLPLAEGYSFRIDEISQDGDSIMVALLRDGEEIKSDIINDDSTYTHTKEVDDEDIPVIAIHIDNIFRGMETNSIFVNGIFQISEDFKKVEEGNSYGKMEIYDVSKDEIVMSNDGSISLGKGDTISIMGDIKIKVADDDDAVRFYPFQEIKVEALESLEIDFPNNIYSNQEFTIKVTSDDDEVEGAYVSFGDIEIGATDSNGELVYTPTETGSFNITASKSGYNSDSSEIEVIFQPTALDITFPSVIDKNELLTILVTSEGSPLSGASVMFGSIDLGTTPSSGNISHTPDEIGTFTISASKSGYQDASKDIDISDPSAKLVFTNLMIDPEVVDPGQIVTISVETANFGTLREAETVILNINEEEESTRDVTLGPGEISTVTFSVNKSKSGKYDVEIGGLEGSFKVTGDSSISIIAMILLGIIGLFSAGAIIYSVSKGDLTFDSMTEKASEIEVKIKRLIEK
ncbi:MAG: Ig-like domain-containing protein [Methanosarcinales archaeon]|nr:Ig-like domain-containing protein [Methanosarcinales archaeon]